MPRPLWLILPVLALPIHAQGGEATKPAPRVTVPTFPNSTCPIMGKRVSMPLFIDTELGRFYVCCKPCYRKILANVPAAHKTAYPVVETIDNKKCPVSGRPISVDKPGTPGPGDRAKEASRKEASRKEASQKEASSRKTPKANDPESKGAETDAAPRPGVSMTLQKYRFQVCGTGCVDEARRNSQVTLAKVTNDKVVDVGNTRCPITAKKVTDNAFAMIGHSLVRLSSRTVIPEVQKDPLAVLDEARQSKKRAAKPTNASTRRVEKRRRFRHR